MNCPVKKAPMNKGKVNSSKPIPENIRNVIIKRTGMCIAATQPGENLRVFIRQ
jgi:hypothetical protein